MGHLIVFVGILILTIGFTVVYQGTQLYRTYRFPAVRSFVLFIAIYNFVGLLTLIAQYLMENVSSLTSDGMYILIIIILGSIGFTFAAIEIGLFASTVWHLSGIPRAPAWFVYGYGIICAGWLATFVLGVYRFFFVADKWFLLDVHKGIVFSLYALDFLLPVFLLVKARHLQPDRHRRMAQIFGLFFVSLACFELVTPFLPDQWSVFFAMLPGLFLNLGLLVYFKPFVATFYGPLLPATDPNLSLDRVCEEFRLSAREREIIQMILKGKSNKDIERELFISSHTVKNHIYHIFQKTSVKSRGQLVSMVLQNSAESAHEQ